MTLFVDASALVAVIMAEPEQEDFMLRIAADPDPIWSAMSCWEAISALVSSYKLAPELARREVENTATFRPFRLVSIAEAERQLAIQAYERYGKGRHRAALNMGDCFAYACAKANGAALLYKGDDFARTDLA